MKYLNFITNKSGICNNYLNLTTNFRLNDIIEAVSI
jgi:hypothetical protein